MSKCSWCNGLGFGTSCEPCSVCQGSGYQVTEEDCEACEAVGEADEPPVQCDENGKVIGYQV